jgi:NAD(P)H-flavin reductase
VTAPVPYRVATRRVETADTVTLELVNEDGPLPAFRAGQFAMLTAYGIGEVPISLSGGGRDGRLTHTLRKVGAVTAALHAARPGEVVGVRGPFGTEWDVDAARGHDVVVVAGGIGLAPLRLVVEALVARPADFGRVSVLVGARTPADLLYPGEFGRWARAAQVAVIVDRPADGWIGNVGLVTSLIPQAAVDPAAAVAFVCGPEVMMRFVADALVRRGIPEHAINVSLERDMRCGAAWCGHCQLGPFLLCRDGPVLRYDAVAPLLRVREL